MVNRFDIKLTIAFIIVAVFAVFVFQNTEVVELRFFVWRLMVSRVLLLFGALALGFAAGMLAAWGIARKRSRGSREQS